MLVGQRIHERMKEKGISQNRLAKAAQISQSGLSTIISGASSPSVSTLQAIAAELCCSVAELLGEPAPGFIPIRKDAVPIIGSIACGERVTPDTTPDGYAYLPEGVHADFALRCKGDSMTPTLQEGDLVLIRHQPDVENGQIAAVSVSGEATLKRVYHQKGGLLLTADNAKYTPFSVDPAKDGEIVVHGLAVGYLRLF